MSDGRILTVAPTNSAKATLVVLGLLCSSGTSFADCRSFPFSQWQPAAERVVLRPETLLTDFPTGGERLTGRVAMIGASSRAGLIAMLKSTSLASAGQRRAIAEGLVAAARLCDRLYPAESRRIELAVARSSDAELRREFQTEFQSQLSQEAQQRSQQLGDNLQRRAASSTTSANTGLFNSRNPMAVPPIRAIAPVRPH